MDEKEQQQSTEQKSQWQQTKEGWYSNLNVNAKNLDIFIWICLSLLVIAFILIGLEAAGIFYLFD